MVLSCRRDSCFARRSCFNNIWPPQIHVFLVMCFHQPALPDGQRAVLWSHCHPHILMSQPWRSCGQGRYLILRKNLILLLKPRITLPHKFSWRWLDISWGTYGTIGALDDLTAWILCTSMPLRNGIIENKQNMDKMGLTFFMQRNIHIPIKPVHVRQLHPINLHTRKRIPCQQM